MLQRIKNKLKEKKGFTLIEMIIVIAIIAILIALIAPNLVKYLDTAKQTKADAAAKTLYTATNTYLADQYAKGASVSTKPSGGTNVTWTVSSKTTSSTDLKAILSEYFNPNEIGEDGTYKMSCTVQFDANGNVAKVTWEDGAATGTYPK
ncbi:MAG: prepilin-type N-terminal cleavage/methylation domain-containing protein [Roseburia sp.]